MVKFSKEFLVDTLGLPYSAMINNIVDHRRWSVVHQIIFKHEDKFYQTYYSEGATECQDESPWEFDDEIECVEVQKVKITTEVWAPIEEAASVSV